MGRLKDLAKNSPTASRLQVVQSFGEVASVGLAFGLSIVIGSAAGWWLDRKFGWAPWGFLVGFVFGLAAGVRTVWVVVRKYLK